MEITLVLIFDLNQFSQILPLPSNTNLYFTDNIIAELDAHRYLGPFNSIDVLPTEFHPFRNAPLGVVPKKHTNPPKFRTIEHLS